MSVVTSGLPFFGRDLWSTIIFFFALYCRRPCLRRELTDATATAGDDLCPPLGSFYFSHVPSVLLAYPARNSSVADDTLFLEETYHRKRTNGERWFQSDCAALKPSPISLCHFSGNSPSTYPLLSLSNILLFRASPFSFVLSLIAIVF